MTDNTELPRPYRTWAAFAVMSALLGRRVPVRVPGQSHEVTPLYTNVFVGLVGPAGSGKGFSLSIALALLAPYRDRVQLSAKTVSRKGLFRSMQRASESGQANIIISGELMSFLLGTGNAQTGKVSSEVANDLNDVFDCGTWLWETEKDGLLSVEHPFLTILGGATMTHITDKLSTKQVTEGFLSRWVFAREKAEGPDKLLWDDAEMAPLVQELGRLTRISGPVWVSQDADAYVQSWKDDGGYDKDIGSRFVVYGYKVAALLAVADRRQNVTLEDVERARTIVQPAHPAYNAAMFEADPRRKFLNKYIARHKAGETLDEKAISAEMVAAGLLEDKVQNVLKTLRIGGHLA